MNYRNLTKARDEFLAVNRRWFSEPTNSLYGKEGNHSYVLFKFAEYLAYRQSFRGRIRRWWRSMTDAAKQGDIPDCQTHGGQVE